MPAPDRSIDASSGNEPIAPRWGWIDLLVGFLGAQFLSLIGFAIYASVEGVPASDIDVDAIPLVDVALLQIPLWFGFGIVPIVATRMRGNGAVRDLGARMRALDAPLGLAIGIACQLILVPLVSLPVLVLSDTDMEELSAPAKSLADRATGPGVVVLVLVVVVAAPLAEELFYRGLLQRTLDRHVAPWWSMGITAAVFAASHGQALQFPALAAFGLVLSLIARRTDRLGLNMWTHAGFNATTVIILLLDR